MIKNFIEKNNIEYYEEASLKRYNTYRIDVKCKYLIFPKDKEEFRKLLEIIKKEKLRHLVLGNGSNVILACDYFDGVVILLNNLNKLKIEGEEITVEAGYSLQRLAVELSSQGLEGLDFATGIPGLIGASVAMNAGAYNKSLSEVVTSVEVITPELTFVTMTTSEMKFAYRSSFFKKNKDYYIVTVNLKLTAGNKEEILEKISKRRVKRLETQPLDMPSAGSVFRNPKEESAGAIIEKCGMKGYSIGGAEISTKHANFIVNKGNATGKEVVQIIEKIKETVHEQYHIELILEQIIIE